MSTTHTDGLRDGAVLEARMHAAYLDGQATAAAGERRANPWDGTSPVASHRVLAQMWARGYSAGNPVRLPR